MEQAPEAKCVSLLSQVMDEFKDMLSPGEVDAVAAWFGKNYKMPPLYTVGSQYFEGESKAIHFKPGEMRDREEGL